MTVAALVLAAGRSQRMGHPKAWLRLDGETLLARIVRTARGAGISPVVVVIGHETDSMLVNRRDAQTRLPHGAATLVVGRPDASQIDSIRAGLTAMPNDAAVLLWPVDHPFAQTDLVSRLVAALERPDQVVLPLADGRRGHPILLGPTVVAELGSPAADQGADRIVRRAPERIVTVAAGDPHVAASLNTPDDAAALGIVLPTRNESRRPG
jgi:CTP:molybdopterin cytidylyltransferase MocA